MRVFNVLIFLGLFILGSSAGFAGAITTYTYGWGTATITTSIGPNLFCAGCSGAGTYINNAINDLPTDSQTGNLLTDPGAYNIFSSVNPADNLVTNYSSWRGLAPNNTLGGTFSNEEGSRLFFGLVIQSNTQFSLSQMSYVVTSTDTAITTSGVATPGYYGIPAGSFLSSVYRTDRVGINTATSTTYTSGSGTNLINELIYVGVSPAFNYADAPDPASLSSAITDAGNNNTPYDIQICYSVSDLFSNACATITETPGQSAQELTPEPGTLSLLGLGIAGMLAMARRLAKRPRE